MRLTVFVKTLDGTAVQKAVILFLYIYTTTELKKCQTAAEHFCCFFVQKTGGKKNGKGTRANENELKTQKTYRKEKKKHDKMEKIKENSDAAFSISDCIHIYAVWYWRGAGGCNKRRYRKL